MESYELKPLRRIRCGDKINCLFTASANFSSIAERGEKAPDKRGKIIYLCFVCLATRVEANRYLFSSFYLAKLDSLSRFLPAARYSVASVAFFPHCNDEAEFVDYSFGEIRWCIVLGGDSVICVTGFSAT